MIYYASRTGNVQAVVDKLGLPAVNIKEMDSPPSMDFILFTYTDGLGDVPNLINQFMQQHAFYCKGIIVSGNRNFGANFCGAGTKLSKQYGIPLGCEIELRGNPSDLIKIRTFYEQVMT